MIIRDAALYYVKMNPKRPVKLYESENDGDIMGWEIELRTTNKETAKYWRVECGGGKNVKVVREDKDDPESSVLYYKWKIRQKQYKANGEPSKIPEVRRGDTGEEMDPRIIGNGSIAHVRVATREFEQGGATVTAHYLMEIAVQELVKYEPKEQEQIEYGGKMKVRDADGNDQSHGNDSMEQRDKEEKPKRKSKPKPSRDLDDEIPF